MILKEKQELRKKKINHHTNKNVVFKLAQLKILKYVI